MSLPFQVPQLFSAVSAYSRMKSRRFSKEMPREYFLQDSSLFYPYYPECLFSIFTLNLGLFPFSNLAGWMFYNFLSYTRSDFYLLQEIKNQPLFRNLIQIWNARFPEHSYRIYFSSQEVNRSCLAIMVSNNWKGYCSVRQVYPHIFGKPDLPLRSPLALFTSYNGVDFCLLNIHGVPYGAKYRSDKFNKFWNLTSCWIGHQADASFVIAGGDWNQRPDPVPTLKPAVLHIHPGKDFLNNIDYFCVFGDDDLKIDLFTFDQTDMKSDLIKYEHFKNWKNDLSDHFPVLLEVRFY